MTNKELLGKQAELFKKALSLAIEEETEKCIENDGKVVKQAVLLAIADTLGAFITSITNNMQDKEVDEVTSLVCDLIRGDVKECRKMLDNNNLKN